MPRLALLTFAAITLAAACGFAQEQTRLQLWYDKPATKWEEALPVGSGRLGAMVFGGTQEERIQFNEDTLWTGKPHVYVREGSGDVLPEIRKLLFEEKDVADLVRKKFLSDPVRQKAYQPFGDLRFTFPGHGKATDYRRQLDLDTAIATTTYKVDGVTYTREVFASHPDNAIIIRISANQPGTVSFGLKATSPHKTATTKPSDKATLAVSGQVLDPVANNEPGMRFQSRVRVIPQGGHMGTAKDSIAVDNADAVTILLVAATDFVNFQDISADPAKRCEDYLAKLDGKAFDQLKSAHIEDHQKLFRRMTINLGETASDISNLPTDQRLKRIRTNYEDLKSDPQLAALFAQYGRYLLIASSRPGDQPANLQGVWNELLNPPWESKYTTNINLQMNYWPAEVMNLSECHEPVFDMVDDLRISGARTAKKMYNARGWVLHHNTDHWRGTAPINNVDGVWPTGGAWMCHHLWDHYLYTGDKDFLAKRAYPAMKEACLFFLDTLVKDPKTSYLVTNPSHSPEQAPPDRPTLTFGLAMDSQLIRALFDYTTEAAGILNIDPDLVAQVKKAREQLPPNQIGKHGQLQEWLFDWDAPNNNHRHMSPLWGLYPGWDINPSDPKVFEAAKVLLKWRGDGSTGWSYSWRIPLHARIGDGEFAYKQFAMQLGKKTLPNLFDLCGPFQIDGNFGAPAGVAEMLLQSHLKNEIDLLPALPKAWPNGSVTGLCARGGFEIDIDWQNGALTKAVVRSKLGNACKLKYGDKWVELKTEPGKTYTVDGQLKSN